MRVVGAILLATAMTLGPTAVWAGRDSVPKPLNMTYSKKLCIAKSHRGGQKVTWVCQADQRCCYDRFFGRKSCQSESRGRCW